MRCIFKEDAQHRVTPDASRDGKPKTTPIMPEVKSSTAAAAAADRPAPVEPDDLLLLPATLMRAIDRQPIPSADRTPPAKMPTLMRGIDRQPIPSADRTPPARMANLMRGIDRDARSSAGPRAGAGAAAPVSAPVPICRAVRKLEAGDLPEYVLQGRTGCDGWYVHFNSSSHRATQSIFSHHCDYRMPHG